MNRRFRALAAIAAGLFGVRAGRADNLNIIVTPTGTSYYQIGVGTGSSETYSAWTALSDKSSGWDTMNTKTLGSGSAINPTYFTPLNSMSFDGVSFNSSTWGTNAAATTYASLITTSQGNPATSATSAVSSLVVLDGSGSTSGLGPGLFYYSAPNIVSGVVQQTSSPASYGYESLYTKSQSIGQLGTTTGGGLETNLEDNAGMAGNGDGDNLLAGEETLTTVQGSLMGLPTYLDSFLGYSYSGGAFNVVDSAGNTVDPTIYVEAPVPLPSAAGTMVALLGVVGVAGYWRSAKRRETWVA